MFSNNNKVYKKILILRFSSIGDIVLTTPVIRNLKKHFPDSHIHYCTKKNFRILLENNPYLDKIHTLENNESALIQELKKENFDLIIDLHNNIRTFRIKLNLGKKSFTFPKLNIKKWLYVQLKINLLPDIHIVDRYMSTVSTLGVNNDKQGLDYFIPEKDKINIQTLPGLFHQGYIAFAIGAQHYTKKLPNNKVIEAIQLLNQPTILLGGKEDFENGKLIEDVFKNSTIPVLNACGQYNLNQSASLLSQSEKVCSNDTGLLHIAAALKKHIYSFWGNTSPKFGMYPYMTSFDIIENNDLKCRPCSKIGHKKCPQGHFKCMNELNLRF